MKATVMYGAGDVRIENVPDAHLIETTDALIAITRACVCGSDLWPYKKMEKSSSVISITKPAHWDEIVAFGKMPGNSGDAEKRIAARPSVEHSREALRDLLQKIRFENCRVNESYLKALGLTVAVQ